MTDHEAGARCADILRTCQYANIATCADNQPWNTPATAVPDHALDFYWSSWTQAVHSQNIDANPVAFLTIYDSTRARGTNNRRCLYLRCEAAVVTTEAEARKAHALIYPDQPVALGDFLDTGLKRFFRAHPIQAWINVLSESELRPDTVKMRAEVPLPAIRDAL